MTIETREVISGRLALYHNVKHVSVVGSWVYVTLDNGAWFKLDANSVTVEVSQS